MDLRENSREERQTQGVDAYRPQNHITTTEKNRTESKKGQPATVWEQLAANYAMLGRAHAALGNRRTQYTVVHSTAR